VRKEAVLGVRDGAAIVVATVAAGIALKLFVLDACRIASPSMEPSLLPGDFVFFNKLPYSIPPTVARLALFTAGISPLSSSIARLPRRGQIVVFSPPDEAFDVRDHRGELFVKRCIGLPGDTIAIQAGILKINGTAFGHGGASRAAADFGPYVVPRVGTQILLSRQALSFWRPIVEDEGHQVLECAGGGFTIDGIPTTSYRVQRDYVFVLGDNAGNSSDSRTWGPLALERVRGIVVLTYWSRDPGTDRAGFLSRLGHTRWDRLGMMIR